MLPGTVGVIFGQHGVLRSGYLPVKRKMHQKRSLRNARTDLIIIVTSLFLTGSRLVDGACMLLQVLLLGPRPAEAALHLWRL